MPLVSAWIPSCTPWNLVLSSSAIAQEMVTGRIQRKFVQKRLLPKSEASDKELNTDFGEILHISSLFSILFLILLQHESTAWWVPYSIGFPSIPQDPPNPPGQLDIEMSFRQSAKLKWVTPKDISGAGPGMSRSDLSKLIVDLLMMLMWASQCV